MSTQWTDELKQEVIEAYQAANPTPENTTEIINELADQHSKTVNGIRMILIKAEVYVTKTPASTAAATSASGEKTPRKSKQDSLDELTGVLKDADIEADDAIIGKLTGKAAEYFIGAFKAIIER